LAWARAGGSLRKGLRGDVRGPPAVEHVEDLAIADERDGARGEEAVPVAAVEGLLDELATDSIVPAWKPWTKVGPLVGSMERVKVLAISGLLG
jgi:hypothetical protein